MSVAELAKQQDGKGVSSDRGFSSEVIGMSRYGNGWLTSKRSACELLVTLLFSPLDA
jgi:hypothetical protein